MNIEFLRLALLVLVFVGYVLLCLWAYAPRNRHRFDAYARTALDDSPRLDRSSVAEKSA